MGHLLRVIGSLGIWHLSLGPLSFVIGSFAARHWVIGHLALGICHWVLCPLSFGSFAARHWVIKKCRCEEPASGFWSGGDVAIARRQVRGSVMNEESSTARRG